MFYNYYMDLKSTNYVYRENPNSKISVVFTHGICGAPSFFQFLIDSLNEVSYYALVLKGHGGTTFQFRKGNKKAWIDQIDEMIKYLESRNQLIICVGHSMGCLLSINQAIKSESIKSLMLICPPMYTHLPPSTMIDNLRSVYFKNTKSWKAKAIKKHSGVQLSKNPFAYIGWFRPFLGLLSLIRRTRKNIRNLKTPAVAYHTFKDELVSNKTYRFLQKYPIVDVQVLEKSSHYCVHEEEESMLIAKINELINNLK